MIGIPRLESAFLVGLVLAANGLSAGCSDEGAVSRAEPRTEGLGPLVEAVPARFGQLPLQERLSGIVKAQNQVTIRAEIEAPIVEVFVRSGDSVERGQPLVKLRDDEQREQLRHSEAAVRLAEAEAAEAQFLVSELEARESRARAMAEQELTSDLEREVQASRLEASRAVAEQAQARVEQARATADERRAAVHKTVVRSPISGRVGKRNAEVGMLVAANTALFVVGNLERLTVEVPLTEGMLGFIREGHPVRIRASALEQEGPIEAELSRISPFLTEGSFRTTGEIDLINPQNRLRPGMFVTVDVLYGQSEEATLVPVGALWEDPRTGRRGVFVVTDQRGSELDPHEPENPAATRTIEFREVRILAEGSEMIGLTDVEPGEWVVTLGQHLLRAGDDVKARVRPTTWARMLGLQGLQREDLLQRFLEEQQRWARERGAEPPDNWEFAGGDSLSGARAPAPR